ncbi:MAG: preprotein translocase subunit SecG [Lachnospiraceae bacterium]|nr:preprotein translocase subunit SecG [Lachnospiraceae bacterium]
MAILKSILTILFIIICVALTVIILFQEGKSAGLGSLSGQSLDTYWSKNKGRSKEGILIKVTTAMVVLFFVLAAVLNIGSF